MWSKVETPDCWLQLLTIYTNNPSWYVWLLANKTKSRDWSRWRHTQYNISGKFLGTSIIFNIIFKTMQYLNLPFLPRTYGRFTLFSGAGSSLQSPEISKHQCTENWHVKQWMYLYGSWCILNYIFQVNVYLKDENSDNITY